FEVAAQFGPGVAAGPGSWWWGAELVEVGIQGPVAGLGHAAVCLPYAHQRSDEVSAAAFGLEGVGGVAGAQPHGDAVAEPDLLGASPGAVDADRAHRPLHRRQAARFVEGGEGVHRTRECDAG